LMAIPVEKFKRASWLGESQRTSGPVSDRDPLHRGSAVVAVLKNSMNPARDPAVAMMAKPYRLPAEALMFTAVA